MILYGKLYSTARIASKLIVSIKFPPATFHSFSLILYMKVGGHKCTITGPDFLKIFTVFWTGCKWTQNFPKCFGKPNYNLFWLHEIKKQVCRGGGGGVLRMLKIIYSLSILIPTFYFLDVSALFLIILHLFGLNLSEGFGSINWRKLWRPFFKENWYSFVPNCKGEDEGGGGGGGGGGSNKKCTREEITKIS